MIETVTHKWLLPCMAKCWGKKHNLADLYICFSLFCRPFDKTEITCMPCLEGSMYICVQLGCKQSLPVCVVLTGNLAERIQKVVHSCEPYLHPTATNTSDLPSCPSHSVPPLPPQPLALLWEEPDYIDTHANPPYPQPLPLPNK